MAKKVTKRQADRQPDEAHQIHAQARLDQQAIQDVNRGSLSRTCCMNAYRSEDAA